MKEPVNVSPFLGNTSALWLLLFCYAMIVASMSSIGVFVSFLPHVIHDLSIAAPQAGFAISLFSLPSALACVPIGRLVDRIGIRSGMVLAGLLAIAGDVCLSQAHSWLLVYFGMCLSGASFGALTVTCPSALVSWLEGDARTRALSFWSTYGPVGYAFGLLLAVPFTIGGVWQHVFLWHAAIFAALTCFVMQLPRRKEQVNINTGNGGLALLFKDKAIIRLGFSLALPNAVAYGVSVVTPSYLARAYGVEVGMSNSGIAAAKIFAMMLGGFVTGYILTKQVHYRIMYRSLVCLGLAALFVLFFPGGGFGWALVALICWLLAFGGMAGGTMAQLPTFVSRQEDIGVVSGLVGQLTSLICLAAPPVYLALTQWSSFWGLSCCVLLVAACLVPYRKTSVSA
ncbi:MFS transporter [Acetobacter thailandicus]|uniref:MFS transporter n=1 Tax=Acetobacter thailandicus TaxID=1502842 RepID=UPI001BAAD783|nr:MFS transporter [Acetobacter thailandicus]MBS0960355.1 MFS transporter [Acetobacter thailandicus]